MGEGAETPASMASRRGIGSTPSAIPPTAPHWRLSGRLATAARPRRRPGIGHAELPASRGGPFLALVCGRFGAVQARVFRPGARRPLGGASPARVRLPLAARRRRLASHWLDAPVEELDPLRGIVAGVLRIIDERAPSGAGTRGRRGRCRPRAFSELARARGASPGCRRPGCSPIWWCSTAISLPVRAKSARAQHHRVKDLTS
jgi:hypothetical protein